MNRMDSTIVIVLSTRYRGIHILKMDGQKKRLWSDGTGGRVMSDRDCDNCAHHSEGGCSVWECSFTPKEDDTISRQAAIDAICGERQADCIPCESFPCGEIKAVQALPSAQPEKTQLSEKDTTSDCISRQAAIGILYNFAGCIVDTPNGDYHRAYKASRYELESLPSAQPEIVRCKDCKHRPIEKDGEIMPPKEDDWKCPCLCDDYFYSWRPKDNFFCASGERREE